MMPLFSRTKLIMPHARDRIARSHRLNLSVRPLLERFNKGLAGRSHRLPRVWLDFSSAISRIVFGVISPPSVHAPGPDDGVPGPETGSAPPSSAASPLIPRAHRPLRRQAAAQRSSTDECGSCGAAATYPAAWLSSELSSSGAAIWSYRSYGQQESYHDKEVV